MVYSDKLNPKVRAELLPGIIIGSRQTVAKNNRSFLAIVWPTDYWKQRDFALLFVNDIEEHFGLDEAYQSLVQKPYGVLVPQRNALSRHFKPA